MTQIIDPTTFDKIFYKNLTQNPFVFYWVKKFLTIYVDNCQLASDVVSEKKLKTCLTRLIDCSNYHNWKLELILRQVDQEFQLSFAETWRDRIKNSADVVAVLQQLDNKDRVVFIKANLDKIDDNFELILALLDQEYRLEFIEIWKEKIKNGAKLAAMLQTLNYTERINFIRANVHEIEDGFESLLDILDEEHRLEFAEIWQYKIKNGAQLAAMLQTLNYAERINFIRANVHKIEDNFESLLDILDEEHRLEFAEIWQYKIKNGTQLAAMLLRLDNENRVILAKANLDKIEDGYALVTVLHIIQKIKSESQRNIRLTLAKALQDKITDGMELARVAEELDREDRPEFIKDNISKVTDGYALAQVLMSLKKTQTESKRSLRLFVAKTRQDSIADGTELFQVAQELDEDDQLEFIENNLDKIEDGYEIGDILELLKGTATEIIAVLRLRLALLLQDKIYNGAQLVRVISQLDKVDRLEFAMKLRDKIENGQELKLVLLQLDHTERLEFTKLCIDCITYTCDLVEILEILEPSSRLEVVALCPKLMTGPYANKVHGLIKFNIWSNISSPNINMKTIAIERTNISFSQV